MERFSDLNPRRKRDYSGRTAYMKQFPTYRDLPDKKITYFDHKGRCYMVLNDERISYKIPVRLGNKVMPPEPGDKITMVRQTDLKSFIFKVEEIENTKINAKSGVIIGEWLTETETDYDVVNTLMDSNFFKKLRS
jgi:hypothetical protein